MSHLHSILLNETIFAHTKDPEPIFIRSKQGKSRLNLTSDSTLKDKLSTYRKCPVANADTIELWTSGDRKHVVVGK